MSLAEGSTAQKAFETLLRDRIAPALRTIGFKGSGQEFSLASSTHWALLGFQRDKWSDRSGLRFTVNVTVVRRDAWDNARKAHPWIGAKPLSRAAGYLRDSELPGYWNKRIGVLMPARSDKWWDVGPSSDTTQLAAEIVDAIERHAVPAMRDHMA